MDRRTWNAKGALLGRLGRPEESLTAYDQSLNLNPGDRSALAAKGRILFDLGRVPEARKAFEDGLILEPNHLDFLSGKAMCLAQESHFDDALSLLAVVFQKDPNHYDAYRTKGLCLLRSGHAADALPCFDFVLKASPKDARVLTWKGEANEALGRNAEAFAAFDSAIDASPEFGEAWRGKGLLHVKVEQFPAAADALAHATVARPTDKALWYMRGFSEERAGEFDAAVQSYDEALRLDARDKVTWNSKGFALVHLKKFDDALRSFDAALALDSAYEPAQSGKKIAEDRIHVAKVEGFAEAVVRFEKHLSRPATRDEVFRYCSVPLEQLDEVIAYVNEPAPLAPDRIEPDDLRKYEAVGAAVLRTVENAQNLNALRLTDVSSVLPHVDLDEARTIWGYIDWVRDAPLEPTPEWHNDDLIRQAMDLPKEEWNLVDLAKELHLGPFEAKKLEVSLKIFEGGGYKISTRGAPEIKRKKTKPQVTREAEVEVDEEPAAVTKRPAPSKSVTKPPDDGPLAKCEPHHAPGVERHACGAWLCKGCVDAGGTCPGCDAPLPKAEEREARKKDREADFSRL